MAEVEWSEPQEPTARAVRFGRIVFCVVGAILLGVGGWYSHSNPHEQVLLASLVLGAGLVLVWLGLALPPKIVAHFGFWLPWFTE
jgi:sulfite exporter TauE/SafE